MNATQTRRLARFQTLDRELSREGFPGLVGIEYGTYGAVAILATPRVDPLDGVDWGCQSAQGIGGRALSLAKRLVSL